MGKRREFHGAPVAEESNKRKIELMLCHLCLRWSSIQFAIQCRKNFCPNASK